MHAAYTTAAEICYFYIFIQYLKQLAHNLQGMNGIKRVKEDLAHKVRRWDLYWKNT